MAAAGALGVERMDRAAGDGGDGVLDEARFVERVSVDRQLDVLGIRDAQAGVDDRRRGAPVLVILQGAGARADLLVQGLRPARVALAEDPDVDLAINKVQHRRKASNAVPQPEVGTVIEFNAANLQTIDKLSGNFVQGSAQCHRGKAPSRGKLDQHWLAGF